jgi:hypothetical protein
VACGHRPCNSTSRRRHGDAIGLLLTQHERDLLLARLFELTVTYVEDDEKRATVMALAAKLGGNPEAMFFEPGRDCTAPCE